MMERPAFKVKPASCCSVGRAEDAKDKARSGSSCDTGAVHKISHTQHIEGMVYLPGGTFLMGTNDAEGFPADGEGPVREVEVAPFYIDPYAVTNEKFAAFVEATGYVTEAERFGWSFVFDLLLSEEERGRVKSVAQQTPWWCRVDGASWHHPEGLDSHIQDRMNHPVVHISWNDAAAYCQWSNTRLPTEEEWEYAARGGLAGRRYPWGDELKPNGQHRCNIWQGKFPVKNHASDGYIGTAPVDEYLPNGYGLYNMVGNAWEWCANWFSPHLPNPKKGEQRAMRGGSYLCHKSYCNRYRVAARSKNTPDSSSGNIGFRVVKSIE